MIQVTIEAAFRAACEAELQAIKPGNVHDHAPGHRMTAADFRRSAAVAARPLCMAGTSLGGRILDSVIATRAAVAQNTNLGIVLLCAPIALAAEYCLADLPRALRLVLDNAGPADTAAAFDAIVLANPGGLGTVARHDVRSSATVPLRAAMAEAADHDSIARQYASDFADLFGPLTDSYEDAIDRHGEPLEAAFAVYIEALARWPDSHVARRHGIARAEALRETAAGWRKRLLGSTGAMLAPAMLAWDAELKHEGINPGTSADLTVAAIFLHNLRNGLPNPSDDG